MYYLLHETDVLELFRDKKLSRDLSWDEQYSQKDI